jgi:two-component system sensor histidine kinase and response regulator WspE
MNFQDMSNFSMLDLFRMEVETQTANLTNNLLTLDSNPNTVEALASLMRAAHSIKGAASIVQIDVAVKVAHALENCFVAAQQGALVISAAKIDVLLQAVDLLTRISQVPETYLANWISEHYGEIEALVEAIASPTPVEELPIYSDRNINDSSETNPKSPATPTTSAWKNLSNFSMIDLFRLEVQTQVAVLNDNLLALEINPNATEALTSLMRAAHSIKGAARIIELDTAVQLAHVMEDCFVAAQQGAIALSANEIDVLLQAVDLLLSIAQISETSVENCLTEHQAEIENIVATISAIFQTQDSQVSNTEKGGAIELQSFNLPTSEPITQQELSSTTLNLQPTILNPKSKIQNPKSPDRFVRVSAENLNRLMGLAGESLVEANWLVPFVDSLMKLRKRQIELANVLEKLQESLAVEQMNSDTTKIINTARTKANECRQILNDRMSELELFARRSGNLSERLYREVIATHMRPFADGCQGFPRMMRDLARQLGKQVKLEIIGKSTQVDRDILERLEAPLTHMLRNAIAHGIESPEERLAAGKNAEGTVRLEALHRAGMLSITVSDDGRGVDLERLRQKIVSRNMVGADMAAQLTEAELMDFLFLPGFSTASAVTEVSGRGVGLDVAQSMVQEVGGVLRAVSQPGLGMSFHLQLPLTLSVMRVLLVEISGEPYGFPLTRIERIVMVPQDAIAVAENHQYFTMDEENIGLVAAYQVLELPRVKKDEIYPLQSSHHSFRSNSEVLPVIVISDKLSRYGLVVDRFISERKLVVRPLDPRLGKVPDISAAALMEDGSPVLIIDIEDMLRSIDNLLASGQLNKVSRPIDTAASKKRKRILVVDDSITVREMERKLLENQGYEVEVAVNGMDGWNAVRTGKYDLIVTDIDMPRMNGIELVSQIKNNQSLKSLPVIIVSYKDREEDRIRGMEVGANYYLTKSSFHDNTLVNAVLDLIGES